MVENLREDEMRNEDDIKHQALIDNTAQGIFNHLKEIENKREIYEKRWIWELLQNALDAAPVDRKIEVEISNNDNKLTFTHNGRPFKLEEVAHLIYHGSTKREDGIGKFGTGFLATHLLSKKVTIKGVREDHKRFEFELNREGGTPDEIKEHMEQTWKRYQESLTSIDTNPNFTVEYEYRLSDISLNTVRAGIEDLTKIAPYVLAFNDKLGVIRIKNKASELTFELAGERNESPYIRNKRVKEERENLSIFHELRIVKSDDVEIAINGKTQDDKYKVETLEGIPRIFVAFPLFGTQDLPFPVVVNSRKFEPTEKRDGIFLGKENNDDITRNKELLKNSIDLFVNLISDLDRWQNGHTLLNLERPPDKDWLDKDWYLTLLKQVIEKIGDVSVVKTEDGSFKPYREVLFPTIDAVEKEKVELLWKMCYSVSDYKDKIPARELAFEWSKIIDGWKSFGVDLSGRQITIEKIAMEVERSGGLQFFKIKLGNDVDEIDTLNDFYALLLDGEKRGLFDTKNILPDQNGNFKNKPNLFKDEGIDETLKDISNKLGIDVRNQLLHSRITENVKMLLQSKKQEEVLNQVINKIKHSRLDDEYLQANIELFNWLLEHDEFQYLEGYPIRVANEKRFTQLSRKDKVLAPKEAWNETVRMYADLFPEDFIISSDYFKKIAEKDKWDKLRNSGFVLTDPIYKETEKINGDDLALLSTETLEEDKEHGTVDDLEINKIAFFEVKDKGIIDTVRKSKDKARKFLRFLFDYIIQNDTGWDNPIEVSCKCGSKHKIYTSLWLGKLKERLWIPVRKDKSEQPNAKNLAMMLKDDETLLKKISQDKPSRLLDRLNISSSELMMNVAAKDDKSRRELDNAIGSLLSTYMTNPSKLSRIAQLAESEPELFIEKMEAHLSTREQIRRNQSIGSLVEKLLKSVLEKEGFKVEVTGAGSDFLIEHDFVKDNVETIFEVKKDEKICSYIEVKATFQDFVRMSLTQGREAKDKIDKYVLCVIPLNGLEEIKEEDVKNRAKLVMDIGQKIQDKVTKVENFKKIEQEAISEAGDIEIEVSEGPIRFKINKTVWAGGKTFEQVLEFFRGTKI